jgi:hypothetical protein
VRICGQPDAEVHVRLSPFGLAARADGAYDLALLDGRPDADPKRPEMDERDREAVLGPDREALPFVRYLAGERDDTTRRRAHSRARGSPDVDPTVLAAAVWVVTSDERPQHRPFDRPAPAPRRRRQREHGQ